MKNFKEDGSLIWWYLTRFFTSVICALISVFTFMIYNLRVYNVYPGETQIMWGGVLFMMIAIIFFAIGPRLMRAFLYSFALIVVLSMAVMVVYHEKGMSNVEFLWLFAIF